MLQEPPILLEAVPTKAPTKEYRNSIEDDKVLVKRALSTRKETASRLTFLHDLDTTVPLFRVLPWIGDMETTIRLQLALTSHLKSGYSFDWRLPWTSGVTPASEEGE